MNRQINKTILTFIFLINIGLTCLLSSEIEGQCSSCNSTSYLQAGFCYLIIRGCKVQISNICSNCCFGYVLSRNSCVRIAQYYNLTNLNPSSQLLNNQQLNSSLTMSVGNGFKQLRNLSTPQYLYALSNLSSQYPIISSLKVYKVQYKSLNGTSFIFYMINLITLDLYLAQVFVTTNLISTVNSIFRNDLSIKKGDPDFSILTGKQTLFGGFVTFSDFTDQRYILVKNFIIDLMPTLSIFTIAKVQYQIVAGINFLFTFAYLPTNQTFRIKIYNPLQGKPQVINFWGRLPTNIIANADAQTNKNLSGIFTNNLIKYDRSNYQSSQFLSVINLIRNTFSTFSISLIASVFRQKTSGTIYVVNFKLPSSSDNYEVRAFIGLNASSQTNKIEYIKKNNILQQNTVSNVKKTRNSNVSDYLYESDPIFTQLYKYFQYQVQIVNLPPIQSVLKQIFTMDKFNYWQYTITYSPVQIAICRYYPDYQFFQVMSYIVDEMQIYKMANKLIANNKSRSEEVLNQKIRSTNLTDFKQFLIYSIDQVVLSRKSIIYKISIFSENGNFLLKILDSGQLFIISSEKRSSISYFIVDNSSSGLSIQSYIQSLEKFLRQKYIFSSYQLTTTSINITIDQNIYKLLFTRINDFKKAIVTVSQLHKGGDRFVIRTIQLLDFAMFLLRDTNIANALDTIVTNDSNLKIQSFTRQLVFTNSTTYILIYANATNMYLYTKNLVQNSKTLNLFNFKTSQSCLTVNSMTNICLSCLSQNFLYKGKCYSVIKNCKKQIGSICGLCDKYSILYNGNCLTNYFQILSSLKR